MPTIPNALKTDVTDKAAALIDSVLVPTHLYSRPPDWRWSYPINLYTKW